MSGLVLDDQSLVALHALQHRRLLDGPGADVSPLLVIALDILLRVRGLPPRLPVVGKLLKEWCLEFCGLTCYQYSPAYIDNTETYRECGLRNRGRGG